MTPQLQAQWARCRGWLAPAMVDTTEAEVLALLEAGRATLWPGERSAMLTQLIACADGLYAHVWLGGGELAELLELQPGAEAWARAQGATAARINGRSGWARLLRKRGYAPAGDELVKVL